MMKASLVPGVCLCLLLLFPATAEPTPQATVINIFAVSVPSPSFKPLEAPVPSTVHVVLTRGAQRLELELPVDGNVASVTADAIARIMQDPVSGRTRRIARGTLALLADVAARFPGHDIEVVSAVRSEPDRTRDGIEHSRHWDGHAIDLQVRGARLSDVRDAMWVNHHQIGLGWYPSSGFIHLDYRPDLNDTAWTQPRLNASNNYNPGWARVARAVAHDSSARRADRRVASRSSR